MKFIVLLLPSTFTLGDFQLIKKILTVYIKVLLQVKQAFDFNLVFNYFDEVIEVLNILIVSRHLTFWNLKTIL